MHSNSIHWHNDVRAEEVQLPQLELLTRCRMNMLRQLFSQREVPWKKSESKAVPLNQTREAAGRKKEHLGKWNDHPAVMELLARLRKFSTAPPPFGDFGPLEKLGDAVTDSPELYLLSRSRATGVLELIYFHPHRDMLRSLGSVEDENGYALFAPAVAPAYLEGAVFVAANLHRPMQLYGERGYRLSLLEGGRLTERLTECTAGSNCRLQPVLGFYDTRVHELFGLDGLHEIVLFCLIMHLEEKSNRALWI
ncbi:hypothetical protein M3223_18775 [Paenibacillus pasadenensis]|uniref:hypothetical protein n=1 Tax=Paenibacillus pasadenensis TaxID=217090 RepID=UPI0020402710|nr:hypothetical protein [Paenibacillus pasadenensis]MCM3749400.1 hypothetical protein [Paenibacillus pasadenensis]